MSLIFEGRFFDGTHAGAAPATATFGAGGLGVETPARAFTWDYSDILVLDGGDDECRLGARTEPDAVLVLPAAARAVLATHAPDRHGRHAGLRQLGAAVTVMIVAAALIAGLLFFGVPAASGPMARATPKPFEQRIGANMAAQIQTVFRRCASEEALAILSPVIDDMAASGEVGFETIHINIVRTSAPNAFALPGGQVMATSGLMDALGDDQEAFLAVMAHELGHVRNRDGLKAFYRNAGLGILLEAITGGSGLAQQAVLLAGQLTQLRHTRAQETQADEAAFEIMEAAGLDPAALARAFTAITVSIDVDPDDEAAPQKRRKMPSWLKTHPDTDARIEAAEAHAGKSGALPISDDDWVIVRNACEREGEDENDDVKAETADETP